MNPYSGQNILGFFVTFFRRIGGFVTGELPLGALVSDEVQVLVLMLAAVSCGLIGTFLVLKKMTMLANSLSHTVLPGLVIAYLFFCSSKGGEGVYNLDLSTLLAASLITAILTVVSTQLLTQFLRLQEDASIGIVSTVMVAIGVVLVTVFTRNTHLGIEAITGNVDALHIEDIKIVAFVALLNVAVIILFFKEFKLCAFDPAFARAQGFAPTYFDYLLMLLTSMTVIAAFRAVGILLVLSFLVGPVLTARLFSHRLVSVLLLSIGIGAGVSLLSVALSRHALSVHHTPVSTSGLLATLLGLVYLVCWVCVGMIRTQNVLHKN